MEQIERFWMLLGENPSSFKKHGQPIQYFNSSTADCAGIMANQMMEKLRQEHVSFGQGESLSNSAGKEICFQREALPESQGTRLKLNFPLIRFEEKPNQICGLI